MRTSEILRKIAGEYGSDIKLADRMIADLAEIELLILDDLGKEQLTDRMGEVLFEVFDRRYSNLKRTWITTNQPGTEIIARFGEDRGKPLVRRITEQFKIFNPIKKELGQ